MVPVVMDGKGWLWGGNGWSRVVVGGNGWFWVITSGYGWFWVEMLCAIWAIHWHHLSAAWWANQGQYFSTICSAFWAILGQYLGNT